MFLVVWLTIVWCCWMRKIRTTKTGHNYKHGVLTLPRQNKESRQMKYYMVTVYWEEGLVDADAWVDEHEEWIVSAESKEEAQQRAIEINDFTMRDYEDDNLDHNTLECEVDEMDVDGVACSWKRYLGWKATEFQCVDCGRTDYFPKENELGKFCNSCWSIQEGMKSLTV
jgi:hypothetical protein